VPSLAVPLALVLKRAAAYIAKMGPAIQRQGGDNHTYNVACALRIGFDLGEQDALEIFRPWNLTCQPPWRERDLIKKLRNAAKYGRGEPGRLLKAIRPRRGSFDTAAEALTAFFQAAYDGAPPDCLRWLLWEIEVALPWTRSAEKGAPNPALIPSRDRGAALPGAVAAYLCADRDERPPVREAARWIAQQAAREHFAAHPPRRTLGREVRRTYATMDAMATPWARDGAARTAPLLADPEEARGTRRRNTHFAVELPEDPETLCAREQEIARFRASLSPREREVFDESFNESEAEVARLVGTTRKTVHSTRNRIRKKARAWGAGVSAEAPRDGDVNRQPWAARTWDCDEEIRLLLRPMSTDEIEDMRAGYPASAYRRLALSRAVPTPLATATATAAPPVEPEPHAAGQRGQGPDRRAA
jgi:hypothetical protein